jgi:hypothetical protein
MRWLCLLVLISLASCDATPAELGLTGAGIPTPPTDPGEVQNGMAGAPSVGTQISPSLGPNTGAGKFWGYN